MHKIYSEQEKKQEGLKYIEEKGVLLTPAVCYRHGGRVARLLL